MDFDTPGFVAGSGRGSLHRQAVGRTSDQTPEGLSFPSRLGKRAGTLGGSQPEWMMLDGFIRHLRVEDSGCTALAYESSSCGDIIGVGLRAAAPPETSCLVFDWFPSERRKKRQGFGFRKDSSIWSPDAAKVVATHWNSMLLRFLLPAERGLEQEFFVYQSDSMLLKRISPCGHTCINCDVGIVCGDDEFAVAHLIVTPKEEDDNSWSTCPVTAEVCYVLSKEGSWRTKCLPIRMCHGEGSAQGLVWWETDAVITFGESICWVDYLRGMLICESVFSPNMELRYVPLPVTPYEGNRHPELGDRGGIFAYRSICVAQDGDTLKFVDAGCNGLWFSPGTSKITSWTLKSDQMAWTLDGAIEAKEFVDLTKCLGLPRMQPIFPLVDMKSPQIVYFVLKAAEETCSGTLLVPVDMWSKKLGRPTAYVLRSSLSSDRDESYTSSCNLFYNEPFLPCQISKFPDLDVDHNM